MAPSQRDVAPVAAAIIADNGKVLMVKRRVSEGQLSWQFPAGAIEVGESEQDAAVRETREETGVDVRPIKVLGHRVHPITGRWIVYVACDCVEGKAHVADTEEVSEVMWCSRKTLAQLVPYPLFEPVQAHLDNLLWLRQRHC